MTTTVDTILDRARSVATRRHVRENVQAYLFLLPSLAVLSFVYLYPMLQLFYLSVFRVNTVADMVYVGLNNFRRMIEHEQFRGALQHNAQLFPAVPIILVLATFLAALLNERMHGWRFYRAIIFLPYVLPVPVIGIAFTQMLQLHGVFNTILTQLGLGFLAQDWLGNTDINMYVIMSVIVWKELGFATILFLARLLSVPQELYEAAEIDGAGWWHRLWSVTVPQLKGIMATWAILEMFGLLSWVFGYIYTMTIGGPGNSTVVLEFFIYKMAFYYTGELGLAAGVATLLFSIALITIPLRTWLEGVSYED